MYKITRDGETVAMTEAPSYVRRAENGCFTLCQEAEAAGIVHNGQVFHLLGRPDMEGAVATVMLEETDAGSEITRAAETGGIMFVTLAEAGSIDATTAAEHADLFAPWAVPVAYKAGNIRRYTDGQLYQCLQDHTSQADWTPDAAPSLWKRVAQAVPLQETVHGLHGGAIGDIYRAADGITPVEALRHIAALIGVGAKGARRR